jgi:hypothetical protein
MHIFGKGPCLAVGGTRRENYSIEEVRESRGVADKDVLALHVFKGIDDEVLQRFDIQGEPPGG